MHRQTYQNIEWTPNDSAPKPFILHWSRATWQPPSQVASEALHKISSPSILNPQTEHQETGRSRLHSERLHSHTSHLHRTKTGRQIDPTSFYIPHGHQAYPALLQPESWWDELVTDLKIHVGHDRDEKVGSPLSLTWFSPHDVQSFQWKLPTLFNLPLIFMNTDAYLERNRL